MGHFLVWPFGSDLALENLVLKHYGWFDRWPGLKLDLSVISAITIFFLSAKLQFGNYDKLFVLEY